MGGPPERDDPPDGNSQVPDEAVPASAALPGDVLIVEDNMIIALDAEAMLREGGVASVRLASGVAVALAMIAERPPAFVLLDVNLGGETSFEFARSLLALEIPFAFMTGYGEHLAFPPEFADVCKVRKPFTPELLLSAIGVRLGEGPG
jgi:CheY-like chemotaxis protein